MDKYLFLPVVNGYAFITPNYVDEKSSILAGVNAVNAIDTRHRIGFRYYKLGSSFEYEVLRHLYLDYRNIEIKTNEIVPGLAQFSLSQITGKWSTVNNAR